MFLFEDSLGIDIRSDYLYAVILGKSLSGFHLLDYMAEPLPPETDESRSDWIVSLLTRFTEQTPYQTAQVLCSIPRKYALIRFMSIPIMQKEDVNKLIRFEAERHIPGRLDNYFYDTHILDEQIGKGMHVLFVAIPRDIVEQHVSLLNQAGLQPGVIDVSGFNALNTLYFQKKLNGDETTTAFLQFGLNETELTLMRGQKLELMRTLYIPFPSHLLGIDFKTKNREISSDIDSEGMLDNNQQVKSDDDSDYETASINQISDENTLDYDNINTMDEPSEDTVKELQSEPHTENNFPATSHDVKQINGESAHIHEESVSLFVERLTTDITESLAVSGLSSQGVHNIDRLIIMNSLYRRVDILEKVGENIGSKPIVISSADNINPRKKDPVDENGKDLSNAIGLALRSFNEARMKLNFLPPEMRVFRKNYGLWISVVLSSLILLSFFMWAGVSYYKDYQRLQYMGTRITQLQPELDQLNLVKEDIKKTKELLESFKELEQKMSLELDILSDLTERIPADYWLNYILLDQTQVSMHGIGESPETLVQQLDASPYLEAVKLERVVEDRFTIEAQIEAPKPEPEPGDQTEIMIGEQSGKVGDRAGRAQLGEFVGPPEPPHTTTEGPPEPSSETDEEEQQMIEGPPPAFLEDEAVSDASDTEELFDENGEEHLEGEDEQELSEGEIEGEEVVLEEGEVDEGELSEDDEELDEVLENGELEIISDENVEVESEENVDLSEMDGE